MSCERPMCNNLFLLRTRRKQQKINPGKFCIMVTLSEIAVQSGFSVPVVSRALSLNPNPKAPKVAAETRRKICETAKRLGYTPNRTEIGRAHV